MSWREALIKSFNECDESTRADEDGVVGDDFNVDWCIWSMATLGMMVELGAMVVSFVLTKAVPVVIMTWVGIVVSADVMVDSWAMVVCEVVGVEMVVVISAMANMPLTAT